MGILNPGLIGGLEDGEIGMIISPLIHGPAIVLLASLSAGC